VLSISVLGPVEVERNGRPVSVPGGKTSELLVRLALEAGVFVRTDRLVDDLWAADAVHTSRNTLQSKIAKLRRALGDPSVVIGGDGGYMLDVDPADVDE
jgi:DNA-binding SARP family transcriptional activator